MNRNLLFIWAALLAVQLSAQTENRPPAQLPDGKGAEAIAGEYSSMTVKCGGAGLLLVGGGLLAELDAKRNYAVLSIKAADNPDSEALVSCRNRISDGTQSFDQFYFRGTDIELSIKDSFDSTCLSVSQKWPSAALQQSVTMYKGRPFMQISASLTALRDFQCPRADMIFAASGMSVLSGCEGGKLWSKFWSAPNKWFSVPRDDTARFFVFSSSDLKHGLIVCGADERSWKELPTRLLGVETARKSFVLELIKWGKAEIRAGDKVEFEFFAAPLAGSPDKAGEELLRQITGR